jgi:diguanylate cyclase (GGDEF)-like protein
MRVSTYAGRLKTPAVFSFSLLLVAFIGWLDYITGPNLTFTLFYLFPVIIVTWLCSEVFGYITSLLCAAALIVELLWIMPPVHLPTICLNAVFRFFILIVIVRGLARIKKDEELLRKEAAREKLSARTDALTGLANGFYFYEILNHEMERARRYNNRFSIAYIDLDNFKDVNDKYGHLVGDELLHKIAVLIKQNIRNIDAAARLGGDEFVVLMPETPIDMARMVIERLNKIFLGEMAKNDWPVTISAGIASFSQIPSTADMVISKADELMYTAKNNGKNRIEEKVFRD